MKKIAPEYENPIDNEIYRGVELFAPAFYKLGFTPNMVTTLANVFNIACIYSVFQKQYVWAAVFYFIGYFFDFSAASARSSCFLRRLFIWTPKCTNLRLQ